MLTRTPLNPLLPCPIRTPAPCFALATFQSFPVSFPLITTGPGMVGALWGVFVFKEVKGSKNFSILAAAFVVSIGASVIIAISN